MLDRAELGNEEDAVEAADSFLPQTTDEVDDVGRNSLQDILLGTETDDEDESLEPPSNPLYVFPSAMFSSKTP